MILHGTKYFYSMSVWPVWARVSGFYTTAWTTAITIDQYPLPRALRVELAVDQLLGMFGRVTATTAITSARLASFEVGPTLPENRTEKNQNTP